MRPGWWRAARAGRQAAVAQGGQSLARKLLLWVLLPQLVLWLAGGVAAYRFASGYVSEAIDASPSSGRAVR